jgi:16S rRNA processing protein RimM
MIGTKIFLRIGAVFMTEERLLNIGKVVNTHGIKGEIKVYPQTDFPEVRFKVGNKLTMFSPEGGQPITIEIVASREQKKMYVLKIKGFDNINQVEKYKGWEIKTSEADRVELEEGEYYLRDIIGCMVETDEGETLGTITDVLSPAANDIWVVKLASGKELLLPVIDEVVLEVDIAARKVKVYLMEGLL